MSGIYSRLFLIKSLRCKTLTVLRSPYAHICCCNKLLGTAPPVPAQGGKSKQISVGELPSGHEATAPCNL